MYTRFPLTPPQDFVDALPGVLAFFFALGTGLGTGELVTIVIHTRAQRR